MNNKTFLRVLVTLLVLVVFFGIATSASAKLKATAAFYVWDDNDLQYRNSLVDLWMDGSETHTLHELGFDNEFYDPQDGSTTQEVCDRIAALGAANDPTFREYCPSDVASNGNGAFAGVLELGIPFDDLDGARAFDFSEDWSLIDCDLNNSGAWNGTDLTYNTLTAFAPPNDIPRLPNWDRVNLPTPTVPFPTGTDQTDFFKILAIDTPTACTNNTCANELITTIYLDLDINGDNQLTNAGDGVPVDASGSSPGGRVCFFARVYPIVWPTTPATPLWSGNPQARFSAGGGDKTVNFNLFGPDAITLENLVAQSPGGIHPYVWLTIVVLLTGIAFVLIRESRQQTREMFVRKDE